MALEYLLTTISRSTFQRVAEATENDSDPINIKFLF